MIKNSKIWLLKLNNQNDIDRQHLHYYRNNLYDSVIILLLHGESMAADRSVDLCREIKM